MRALGVAIMDCASRRSTSGGGNWCGVTATRPEPAQEPQALTLVPVYVTTDPSTTGNFDSSAWNGSPSRIEIVLPN